MSKTARAFLVAVTLAACAGYGVDSDSVELACPDGAISPEPRDSVLLHTAAAVIRIGSEMRSVWPGFWSADQPFVLTVPEQTVLAVSHEGAPDDFDLVCGLAVPRELHGRAYILRGIIPDLDASRGFFDLAFPLGSVTATAVPLTDSIVGTVAFLVHEAFHAYQDRRFPAPARNEGAVPEIYADSLYNKLAQIERRLLAAALWERTERRRQLLKASLAVRNERQEQLPMIAVLTERELEAIEGTAQLVGIHAAMLVTEQPVTELSSRVRELLMSPLDETLQPRWRHRARFYGTGAALGLLLDPMDEGWRSKVEQGAYLDQLLASALGFSPPRDPALVSWAIREFGIPDSD